MRIDLGEIGDLNLDGLYRKISTALAFIPSIPDDLNKVAISRDYSEDGAKPSSGMV